MNKFGNKVVINDWNQLGPYRPRGPDPTTVKKQQQAETLAKHIFFNQLRTQPIKQSGQGSLKFSSNKNKTNRGGTIWTPPEDLLYHDRKFPIF